MYSRPRNPSYLGSNSQAGSSKGTPPEHRDDRLDQRECSAAAWWHGASGRPVACRWALATTRAVGYCSSAYASSAKESVRALTALWEVDRQVGLDP
jgi:hypothetical protein